MKKSILALIAAALSGAIGASPAFAESDEVCLQNERIWSWRVINERTLVVTDVRNQAFLVSLGAGCVGLNNMVASIGFNTRTNLGCLKRGDRVSFREPTFGATSCFVRDVQPYAPKATDQKGE